MKVGSPPATAEQLVAQLEALTGDAELSHDQLSDQSIDDHHSKSHAALHVNGTDDIRDATASVKGLATAAQIAKVDSHKTLHVDGTDDIRNATASVKGLATSAQITKLDSVEAGAKDDQTGAEMVAALEAQSPGSQLSHGQLDDIGASVHHTKTIDAAELSTGVLSLARIPSTLTDKDADTVDGFHAVELLAPPLTLVLFQANAATGNMLTPELINDGSTAAPTKTNVQDRFSEIDFGATFVIIQYRHYGDNVNNNDGYWKIQYWDGNSWVDWETDIPTRGASWTSWLWPAVGAVATRKIRWIAQTIDSEGDSHARELEIIY